MTSRHGQQPRDNLQLWSHHQQRVPYSFQRQPTTSSTLVPTSFALAPDSQPTVAISRGQATTVLSEHRNKEQRKRTQQRSATMFAVYLLCVLRATFVHARTRQWAGAHVWMSGRAYESSLSMPRPVYRLKTRSAVLWQRGWSGTNKKWKKNEKKNKKMKKLRKRSKNEKNGKMVK